MKKENKFVLNKDELTKFQQIYQMSNNVKQLLEIMEVKDDWLYKIEQNLTNMANTIIDSQEKSGSVDLAIIGQYFIDIIDNIPLKELSKVSIEFTTLFSLIKDVQTQIKDVKQQMQSYEELTNLLKQYDSIIKQIQQADKDMHDETQPTSMNTINYDKKNDIVDDKIFMNIINYNNSIINELYQFHEDEWHNKEDIINFIQENDLYDVLISAPANIREVFGNDIKLALELQDDPEEDWTELFVVIKYHYYSPQKDVKLHDKLFYRWWVTIMDKVGDKLNFTSEPL